MRVTISKSKVKQTGKLLRTNADDLRTELRKISNVFDKLSYYWSGDDFISLREEVNDKYLSSLKKLANKWDGYGKYLEKVPNAYDEVENTFARRKIK